jgi:histidine triad (HIT) family protein
MSLNCLFCKINEGTIPSTKVFENENVFAFVDIHPQAKKHFLFVHKNHTENINEMSLDSKAIGQIFVAISEFTNSNDLSKNGFRVVTNLGKDGGQTVFHTHYHVLGGETLGSFGS